MDEHIERLAKAEHQFSRLWTEHGKLKTIVLGNGSDGHEQRIRELEERCKPTNCIGLKAFQTWLEKEEVKRDKYRTWRIGDVANVINMVLMIVAIVAIFIKVG